MERLGVKSHEDFLTENFNFLSNFTKAEDFMTWLRTCNVLSEDDQEVIYARTTTKAKAAHLIDNVMKKGQKGFLAYMQVIEWVYPDIFLSLTKLEAQAPPDDFQPKKYRASVLLIKELNSCMGALLGDNLDKKVNIDKLKLTVSQLQKENDKMISEMGVLKDKLQEGNDKAEELLNHNKDLMKRTERWEDEKKELSTKLQEKSTQLILLIETKICPGAKEKIEKTKLEEHFNKMTTELNENQKENNQLKENIDQLLTLNRQFKSDLEKAKNANTQQRKTITHMKQVECDVEHDKLNCTEEEDKRKCAIE